MGFLPASSLNSSDNELARVIRHNGDTAEFHSFKLPKRFGMINEFSSPQIDPVSYEEWESSQIPKDELYLDFENLIQAQAKVHFGEQVHQPSITKEFVDHGQTQNPS